MSVTDEIKARLDIVNYISQYVPLKKAGRTYKACCPFHNEKSPSFVVDADKQTWRCYGACADGGDIFSFAQRYNGWDFRQSLEELGKIAGVEVRKLNPQQREENTRLDALRGLMKAAAEYFHQQLIASNTEDARATLAYATHKRGFTTETITAFQIGFAPPGWSNLMDKLTGVGYSQEDLIDTGLAVKNDAGRVYDRFRNRLMIPISDERGRVVGFGARALNAEDNPKYLNSPQTPLFDKSKILFGLDTAKRAIRDSETAVIVEGYMDVIQAQQAGFYNVVAQMGTAMTETQLGLIAPRYAKRVILALDADAAGQNAARRSLEVARQALQADYAGRMSVDMRVLQIPGAKDPDDLIRETPDAWAKLIEDALPVADFVIQMETEHLPSNPSIQEREALARRVLPLLLASENNLYTQENVQKLALKLRIPETDLMQWAREQPREQKPASRPAPSATSAPAPVPKTQTPAPPDDGYIPAYTEDDESYYAALADYDQMPFLPAEATDTPPGVQAPADDDLQPVMMPPRPAQAPVYVPEADNQREGYCLRLLFLYPAAYYQINRRLREAAANDAALLSSALDDFGVADFTRYDYRTLMQMFLFGLRQAEDDLLDFLRQALDPAILIELERLIGEESVAVTSRINGRFDADASLAWKQYERRTQASIKPDQEAILKALELRRARLKREVDRIRFDLIEAERKNDTAAVAHITSQFTHTRRALERLDSALDDQRRQFA